MFNPSTILITGASSGIGAALARGYAAQGVTLGLLGRDAARLATIAAECRVAGATVETGSVDVCDAEAMRGWMQHFDAAHPVDLVIANAGISGGLGEFGEGETHVRAIFDVNIGGVINTVWPLVPRMIARGRGQIALMASLASIRPLPSAPAYSASKACVRFYGDALHGQLKRYGVRVSVIAPGFIDTRMTRVKRLLMRFLMSEKTAATRIIHAVSCGKRRIFFPKRLYLPLYWASVLSSTLTDFLFDKMPSKPHVS